jgi:glycosyltransferase involved in cell wall biosynthesis
VKSNRNLLVLCAGGGEFTKEERVFFKTLNILDKVKFESASDQNLQKLYSGATAFFYPSLYEGFGIPILEAMNCGCPVAASNVSSIPEVGGEAICYFDPINKSSIYDAASSLLTNDSLRQRLREKGYERAKEFSWKKTSEETYKSYLTLI